MGPEEAGWRPDGSTNNTPAAPRQPGRKPSGWPSVPKLPVLTPKFKKLGMTPKASTARRHTAQTPRSRAKARDGSDSPPGSARGSVCSSQFESRSVMGDEEADSSFSTDNVKVLVRVRPLLGREVQEGSCVNVVSSKSVSIQQPGHEPQGWTFDFIAGEATSQQEMFCAAGQPLVENCIAGYNSSIFAYGQTGSGKTHTMQGSLVDREQRGLSSRVFEWLFKRIAEEEAAAGRDLRYSCKGSFLEIYNETISDLLKPGSATLQLREDVSRGCFVEGLSEEVILNAEDAVALIRRGAQNRKIGHTRMNCESSRSHSVFTCTIESASRSEAGLTSIRFSRLNLVDLAGSERNKASGASGEHFKEACLINQSLSALGRVIMELVDAQRTRRHTHIPYRDSRLTFLLQDSLGGNAKSMIIANVGPSLSCLHETLSTLQFVSRAKQIRNKAIVNQDTQAVSMELLKREVQRLSRELELVRSSTAEPLVGEVSRLTDELNEARRRTSEARAAAAMAASEAKLATTGARWAEDRVSKLERDRTESQEALATLNARLGCKTRGDEPLSSQISLVSENSLAILDRLHAAEAAQKQAEVAQEGLAACLEEAATGNEKIRAEALAQAQSDLERESHHLREALAGAVAARAAAEAEGEDLRRELTALDEEAVGLREKVTRHEGEASELEVQVSSIRSELTRRDAVVHEERLQREETIRRLASERNALHASLSATQAEALALRQSAVENDLAAGQRLEDQKALEARLEAGETVRESLEDRLREQLDKSHGMEADSKTLRQELAALQLQREESLNEAERAKEERRSAVAELTALQSQLEVATAAASLAEQNQLSSRKESEGLKKEAGAILAKLNTSEAALAQATKNLAALQLQLEEADISRIDVEARLLTAQKDAEERQADLEAEKQARLSLEAQLRKQRQAAFDQQARADSLQERQASEILELRMEIKALRPALDSSRQAEADALVKAARFKHMLGDIDSIVKWARSPGGTPTTPAMLNASSFRKGGLPSPPGNTNPLFQTQWSASPAGPPPSGWPDSTPPAAHAAEASQGGFGSPDGVAGAQRESDDGFDGFPQPQRAQNRCPKSPAGARSPSGARSPGAEGGRRGSFGRRPSIRIDSDDLETPRAAAAAAVFDLADDRRSSLKACDLLQSHPLADCAPSEKGQIVDTDVDAGS